jgi:integrase/recombinase XerD
VTPIRKAARDYLAMRRALGFALRMDGSLLLNFVSFLAREGAIHLTTDLALRWAKKPIGVQPAQWANRLALTRRFATFLSASDPYTEIPPRGLLPFRYRRRPPHIYRESEIRDLLLAARHIASSTGLHAATYSTLIGILVAAGLRINEALGLDNHDVDAREGVLTIRHSKGGKSRLVPVHRSTVCALQRYMRVRDRRSAPRSTDALFVQEDGRRLSEWAVRARFIKLSREIGLRGETDRRGPRLHDFRHYLAIKTLIRWYRRGVDVELRLPVLSTYLGHSHVTDTYWYLTAVPELLQLAAQRLETRRRHA